MGLAGSASAPAGEGEGTGVGEKQLSEILDLSQHSSIIYPLPPTLIEDIAKILETLKSFRSGCMKPRLPPHLEMFSCLLVPPHVLIVRFPPLSLEGGRVRGGCG